MRQESLLLALDMENFKEYNHPRGDIMQGNDLIWTIVGILLAIALVVYLVGVL